MKHVAFFLTVALSLSFGQQMPERKLYWIHGLKESSSFWNRYYSLFPQTHKVDLQRSRNVDYTSTGSITNIATVQVAPQLPPLDPNEPVTAQPIGIGHSMGGLIARTIEQTFRGSDARFCAIITVGTPNTGALIVNNIMNGSAAFALRDGIYTILDPLGRYLIRQGLVLMDNLNIINPQTVPWAYAAGSIIFGYYAGDIANAILTSFNHSLAYYASQPSSDMMVGSNYMRTLQERMHQIPVVAIWGNERARLVYRLGCSFIRRDDIPNDPLDYTDDNCIERIAYMLESFSNGEKRSLSSSALFELLVSLLTANPALLLQAYFDYDLSKRFDRLEWYCRVGAEDTWRRLIGATWVDTIRRRVSQYYYNPSTRQWHRIPSVVINAEDLGDPERYQQYRQSLENLYEEIYVLSQSPSDALIVRDSQIGVPGLLQAYEAKGANHLEQGNHPNVRKAFEDIFSDPNRESLYTPKR